MKPKSTPAPKKTPVVQTGNRWELDLIDRMARKMGFSFHILRIALSISALVTAAKLILKHWG